MFQQFLQHMDDVFLHLAAPFDLLGAVQVRYDGRPPSRPPRIVTVVCPRRPRLQAPLGGQLVRVLTFVVKYNHHRTILGSIP